MNDYRLLFSEYYAQELSDGKVLELEQYFAQYPEFKKEYEQFAATLDFIAKGEVEESDYDFASMLATIKQTANRFAASSLLPASGKAML